MVEVTQEDREYLVRKGGYFYRPNACGYTGNPDEAGRFTLAQAISHSHPNGPNGPRDGIDYIHQNEVTSPATITLATADAAEPASEVVRWRPIETWDKRDDLVLLLVDYTEGGAPLDDVAVGVTIGLNHDHNAFEGEGQGWQFAGWSWCHDVFCQGSGKVLAWAPLHPSLMGEQEWPRALASDAAAQGGDV